MNDADRVIELDLPWQMTPGADCPVVLQSNGVAVVVAYASHSSGHEGESVVLTFDRCTASRFGYPNDEALAGHPLYGRGLTFYAIHEVLNSAWLTAVQAQNRVAFPNSTWAADRRHFIVTMHDDTFECLAASVTGRYSADPRPELLASLARQLS